MHMLSNYAILENSIAAAMERLNARAAARPAYTAPVRSVPSDEAMHDLIQARKRRTARLERHARRRAAVDIRTRLLVGRADVLRRARALHDDSTFTWRECMIMAWHEAKCRTFLHWGWLSDHHQTAAALTRRLISLELAAAQEPELAQTGARRDPDLHRDEINRLRMSLLIVAGYIDNLKDRTK
jgi:hypothetical protein